MSLRQLFLGAALIPVFLTVACGSAGPCLTGQGPSVKQEPSAKIEQQTKEKATAKSARNT